MCVFGTTMCIIEMAALAFETVVYYIDLSGMNMLDSRCF